MATTKAEEVWDKVEALVASGTPKAEAFKKLASEYGQPVDSVRGAYYGEKRKREGGGKSSRPRRRETTPEDALADARASLERSIEAIDREVEVAKERADEAKAEHEALKASAGERKKVITERLEALN
jgi:flagellar motility protein MotE (MotC chaperone)